METKGCSTPPLGSSNPPNLTPDEYERCLEAFVNSTTAKGDFVALDTEDKCKSLIHELGESVLVLPDNIIEKYGDESHGFLGFSGLIELMKDLKASAVHECNRMKDVDNQKAVSTFETWVALGGEPDRNDTIPVAKLISTGSQYGLTDTTLKVLQQFNPDEVFSYTQFSNYLNDTWATSPANSKPTKTHHQRRQSRALSRVGSMSITTLEATRANILGIQEDVSSDETDESEEEQESAVMQQRKLESPYFGNFGKLRVTRKMKKENAHIKGVVDQSVKTHVERTQKAFLDKVERDVRRYSGDSSWWGSRPHTMASSRPFTPGSNGGTWVSIPGSGSRGGTPPPRDKKSKRRSKRKEAQPHNNGQTKHQPPSRPDSALIPLSVHSSLPPRASSPVVGAHHIYTHAQSGPARPNSQTASDWRGTRNGTPLHNHTSATSGRPGSRQFTASSEVGGGSLGTAASPVADDTISLNGFEPFTPHSTHDAFDLPNFHVQPSGAEVEEPMISPSPTTVLAGPPPPPLHPNRRNKRSNHTHDNPNPNPNQHPNPSKFNSNAASNTQRGGEGSTVNNTRPPSQPQFVGGTNVSRPGSRMSTGSNSRDHHVLLASVPRPISRQSELSLMSTSQRSGSPRSTSGTPTAQKKRQRGKSPLPLSTLLSQQNTDHQPAHTVAEDPFVGVAARETVHGILPLMEQGPAAAGSTYPPVRPRRNIAQKDRRWMKESLRNSNLFNACYM
eukprot:TRINITY_DN67212_c1_g4_i1.p1 TRINITY_DN67212_c1_g4~~TRINITY_DN67212_c1_g4_i1.p1  ORF type:complete len:730 (+),score=40.50 TRINITY_DN67212_c1_g4_i1:24-2213(+)